jgi:hypothetical protein
MAAVQGLQGGEAMTEGDYTYVLESADDGEKHEFVCKAGVYTADGIEQTDPMVQCLMDATLDLLLEQKHLTEHINALMDPSLEVCDDCSPHFHPGSGRSH